MPAIPGEADSHQESADSIANISHTLGSRRVLIVLGLLTIFLFALGNLPWTLDDYDQAKQAFISYQMIDQHRWLYQTTPGEGTGLGGSGHHSFHISTKPPAVGWLSAFFFGLTRSWDFAWHFPSCAAGLALAALIYFAARRAWGDFPAFIALAAFGLNMLSVRLATLVRTDMPLALTIFAVGWLMWEKVRQRQPWTARDRLVLGALLTASLFIKGPVVYAFVLPPLVLYQWRRKWRPDFVSAWSGWSPWLISLGIFLAWVGLGIRIVPGFWEDVVLREFLGRFHEGPHRFQSLPFYYPHLLQKFAPWSLLIIALAVLAIRRTKVETGKFFARLRPEDFWLIAWAVGGILVMTIIPSKRVDRIYPAIPMLCLLLAAQVKAAKERPIGRQVYVGVVCAIIFAFLYTTGYAVFRIGRGYRLEQNALDRFGRKVREIAAREHLRFEVVRSDDEGLLLYLQRPRFVSMKDLAEHSVPFDAFVAPLRVASRLSQIKPRLVVKKKGERPAQYGFFVLNRAE